MSTISHRTFQIHFLVLFVYFDSNPIAISPIDPTDNIPVVVELIAWQHVIT